MIENVTTMTNIEIFILMLVAFALGYFLRWLVNEYYGCQLCDQAGIDYDAYGDEDFTEWYEEEEEQLVAPEVQTTETVAPVVVAPTVTVASAPANIPVVPVAKVASTKDDLKIVEGVGPKIEELLNNNDIHTWEQIAVAGEARLREILVGAGERYRIHDPSTWGEQARLADEEKWAELEEFQQYLSGGKIPGK